MPFLTKQRQQITILNRVLEQLKNEDGKFTRVNRAQADTLVNADQDKTPSTTVMAGANGPSAKNGRRGSHVATKTLWLQPFPSLLLSTNLTL